MWGISICFLIVMFIILRRRRSRIFRRWWVKPFLQENVRNQYGAYSRVFLYFKLRDHEEFFNFTGMTVQQYEILHELMGNRLLKRSNRQPLSPELKLTAVLNFLVNRKSITQSSWFFRIGRSTMYKLVPEVCNAIIESLESEYLVFPSTNDWLEIANGFHQLDFPHCIGAIDGKHFRIKSSPHSGSWFFNFRKFYSIVLMATCDVCHRFTWVSIGDFGSMNDAGILQHTNLGRSLETNIIRLPENQVLPNTDIMCPYFFIGDGGFPLKSYLMKPYRKVQYMPVEEKLFNIRLSRARKSIECAFGILVKKFKIFEYPMDWKLETAARIIMCTICLHNFRITAELNGEMGEDNIEDSDIEQESIDSDLVQDSESENSDGNVNCNEDDEHNCDFDSDESNDEDNENIANDAVRVRQTLIAYFVSAAGNVPWQWNSIE